MRRLRKQIYPHASQIYRITQSASVLQGRRLRSQPERRVDAVSSPMIFRPSQDASRCQMVISNDGGDRSKHVLPWMRSPHHRIPSKTWALVCTGRVGRMAALVMGGRGAGRATCICTTLTSITVRRPTGLLTETVAACLSRGGTQSSLWCQRDVDWESTFWIMFPKLTPRCIPPSCGGALCSTSILRFRRLCPGHGAAHRFGFVSCSPPGHAFDVCR